MQKQGMILAMPRGGIRPRRIDGSTDHLLKPKWKQGRTRTIRVPVVLAEQLLEIAHRLDLGNHIDLTHDNGRKGSGHAVELTQDNTKEGDGTIIELTQDNRADLERIKASQAKALALLQNAIKKRYSRLVGAITSDSSAQIISFCFIVL